MKKSSLIITLFLLALTLNPALAQAPEGEEYIVQADDWLSKIAEKTYGDVLAYPAIIEATNAKAAEDDTFAVIDNPDLIEVGQKLWIPADAEGVALAGAAPAPPANVGEAWESVACDTFGVAPEIAPMADCGYVTVQENRAVGSDNMIKLAVVRTRTDSPNPGAPVFLAIGGPGGNGLIRTADIGFISPFIPIIADHDFIFFSQRGTEHAIPHLTCPGYTSVPVEAALNNWSDEERQAQLVATMQACIDEAAAQGINLSGYNTNENAADVNSIRQALGYDQIILYGQSYGTQLAQFVMRNHPEILESVILDGILAASSTTEAEYSSHRDAFQRYFTACAADEACNAAYPDPETALAEAYTALEANPQQIETVIGGQPVTLTVDGTLALTVLYSASFGMGRYATVPLAAYQMRDGDWSQLSQALPDVLDPIDYLMHLPMICTDDPNTSLTDVDTADTADMYIDVEYEDANRYVSLCPLLNAAPLPDGSDELVVSDIPTLLLQGGLDPATAVANGNIVETGLSNSYNVIFPAGTHIQGTSPCGAVIMAAFMADPTTAPDTSCIEQGFAFAVPRTVTVSSEDGSASISMDLPAGFQELPSGGYSSPPLVVSLQVLPPQTPEAAITNLVSTVGLPENEIVDGDPVAGLPSKRYQADEFQTQGVELAMDVISFADDAATYLIIAQNQEPGSVEQYRAVDIPALLETVTVGGQ